MEVKFICQICHKEIIDDEMLLKVKLPLVQVLGRTDKVLEESGQAYHVGCFVEATKTP